jgi:hypothetical protein
MVRTSILFVMTVTLCGCLDALENQTKKSPNSIVGKTTQDVGKFDPNAGNVVSDSKIRADNIVTAPVQAYGPMLEQLMKSHVAQAINLFHASNDRYPKDYDEFMEQIIKANNIKLPVLPSDKKYQYDETNHVLVVVENPAEGK